MNESKTSSLQSFEEMINPEIDFYSIKVNADAQEQKEAICDLLLKVITNKVSIEKFITEFPQSLFNAIPIENFIKGFLLGAILFDNGDKQRVDSVTQKITQNVYDSALNFLHLFVEEKGINIGENLKLISDIVIKKHPDMYFHYKEYYQLPLNMDQLFFFADSGTFKYALASIEKKELQNVHMKNQAGENIFHALLSKSNVNNLTSLLVLMEKTDNKILCEKLLSEEDNKGNIPLMTLMKNIHDTDRHLSGNLNNNTQVKFIEVFEFFKKNSLLIDIYHENKEGQSIQSLYSELLNQDILKEELGKIFVECEKKKLTGLIQVDSPQQLKKNAHRI